MQMTDNKENKFFCFSYDFCGLYRVWVQEKKSKYLISDIQTFLFILCSHNSKKTIRYTGSTQYINFVCLYSRIHRIGFFLHGLTSRWRNLILGLLDLQLALVLDTPISCCHHAVPSKRYLHFLRYFVCSQRNQNRLILNRLFTALIRLVTNLYNYIGKSYLF